MTSPPARILSIVIPAYNEERFIGALLDRIQAVDLRALGFAPDIIVVDDCSTDRTASIAASHPGVRVLTLARNSGKGRAVREGMAAAAGELVMIQDADLEYDPADYVPMLQCWLGGGVDVVYGSRYLVQGWRDGQSLAAYAGGRSLSVFTWLLTGQRLTDTVASLKLFRRADVLSMPLETEGFELEHELTARLAARGKTIAEVPIRYQPRTREEGKKIGALDWARAIRTLYRYRRG